MQVLVRPLRNLVGAWIITSLVAILTVVDAGALSGKLAWLVCVVTESGSAHWVAAPLLGFLLILLVDPGVTWSVRKRQTGRLFVVLALALPLFALVNERIVKPLVSLPRPSHLALAEAGYIPDLDMFYESSTLTRHEVLAPLQDPATARDAAQRLHVDSRVLDQWVREVSSTFPSGHAWNAFLAASLIALAAAARGTRVASAVSVALLAWASAVSWSRVLLGVHRPVDVIAGATLGILVGLVVGWRILRPSTGVRGAQPQVQ